MVLASQIRLDHSMILVQDKTTGQRNGLVDILTARTPGPAKGNLADVTRDSDCL